MFSDTIPAGWLCVLFVLLFFGVAQAGLALFNVWYDKQQLSRNNEVAGLTFSAQGLIYSLLLAYVIIAVWTDYEKLNGTIEKETDKLNNILAHSSTLPDRVKAPLATALFAYCNQVINKEWKMRDAEIAHEPSAIPALRLLLLRTAPQNKIEETIYAVISDDLSAISDLRRERLGHTRSHIPRIVWLILALSSALLIIFFYFLNAPSKKLQQIYLFFISSIIAMSLFLVHTLDQPFDGTTQVSKKPYQNILLELKQHWSYAKN